MKAVIFGSSSVKEGDKEYQDAYEAGKLLAEKGYSVVNGGYLGVMEAVSKGAKDAGGKAIGVTCRKIEETLGRKPNKHISEVVETKDLFERMKKYYTDDVKFVVVFPGGTGTLTEMMLACDLMGLDFIQKMPIIVFGEFWKPVIEHIIPTSNAGKGTANFKIVKDINEFKEFLEKQ